jgi:hypothetical protein
MNIDELRKAAIDAAKTLHPEGIQFRTQVGIGDDYVEILHELDNGGYAWINSGIYLDDIEKENK